MVRHYWSNSTTQQSFKVSFLPGNLQFSSCWVSLNILCICLAALSLSRSTARRIFLASFRIFLSARRLSCSLAWVDLSSLTRDWIWVSCIARQILNHWTTREVTYYEEGIHRAWTPSQAYPCWSWMAISPVDSELCAEHLWEWQWKGKTPSGQGNPRDHIQVTHRLRGNIP